MWVYLDALPVLRPHKFSKKIILNKDIHKYSTRTRNKIRLTKNGQSQYAKQFIQQMEEIIMRCRKP